jgi:hypothetical protein
MCPESACPQTPAAEENDTVQQCYASATRNRRGHRACRKHVRAPNAHKPVLQCYPMQAFWRLDNMQAHIAK